MSYSSISSEYSVVYLIVVNLKLINFYFFIISRGEKEVLRKRLKNHYKETTLKDSSVGSSLSSKFDYVCVIDYEATCVGTQQKDYPHEIIEFPIVLVNMKTLKIVIIISQNCLKK